MERTTLLLAACLMSGTAWAADEYDFSNIRAGRITWQSATAASSSFRTAFPLKTDDFDTSGCCTVGGHKGPICALVLCKPVDIRPIDTNASNAPAVIDTSSCCAVGGNKSPICKAVRCADPRFDPSTNQRWSGKLFDSATVAKPISIYDKCKDISSSLCKILSDRVVAPNQPLPFPADPIDAAVFRKHLEAFRVGTEYARSTNQISATEYGDLIKAYKQDYRSAFGTKGLIGATSGAK